jgi:hypothetical protein
MTERLKLKKENNKYKLAKAYDEFSGDKNLTQVEW